MLWVTHILRLPKRNNEGQTFCSCKARVGYIIEGGRISPSCAVKELHIEFAMNLLPLICQCRDLCLTRVSTRKNLIFFIIGRFFLTKVKLTIAFVCLNRSDMFLELSYSHLSCILCSNCECFGISSFCLIVINDFLNDYAWKML